MSLDIEVIEELKKEKNYSNIVNEEMLMYFNNKNSRNLSVLYNKLTETKQFIKEKRKKARELTKKIDHIKLKEQSVRQNMTMGEFIAQRRRLIEKKRSEKLKGGVKK